MDEKYVTYKRGDLELLLMDMKEDHFGEYREEILNAALDDAVVIRTQDILAASGLSAYARSAEALAAVLRSMLPGTRHDAPTLYQNVDNLDRITEYFDQVAMEAVDKLERGECKVPD